MHALRLWCATFAAGTKRPQVIEGVNACAMAIVPVHFDGIISDRPDFHELCIRLVDEFSLRPVTLAKSARTIAAQVNFGIFADMAVVPGDTDDAA